MAKKSGSKLLRKEAIDIAKKLQAEITDGGKHAHAIVRWGDTLIAKFGIRNSKKSRHGHIPSQIFVSESQALALARCTLSHDEYFELLRGKGKLPE